MKEQKKSSWGAVLVSFLKEFLLNSFEAPGHLYYDENLTNEGKRKKNYIWRVLLLVTAEYYGAAEPPVRCGESHLSGLTEPLRSL